MKMCFVSFMIGHVFEWDQEQQFMLVKISNSNFWKFRGNEVVGATARETDTDTNSRTCDKKNI